MGPSPTETDLRMRKTIALALALGLASPALVAQQPAATTAPVPLLWKACDADNCLYLLGSFHLLRSTDYPLSQDVDAAFADAEQLVFEIPPQEMESPELQQAMLMAAMRRDGSTLSSELTPQQNAKLDAWLGQNEAALAKQGIAPAMFQMFKPWFASLMVTMTGMTELGMQPDLGLDRHFMGNASKTGKPVGGLETGVGQIELLAGMTPEEQRQMLEESLDSVSSGGIETQKLHDAWRRGDVEALINGTIVEMQKEYPRLYQVINVDRNDAWVPKLEARLKAAGTDDYLVVVGAMHLLGSDGVVEKLRGKGYQVERICTACTAQPGKK
ncbi:MAG: TraB/GumN family protein [Xanthomonadaceae bacterium]|nr:TraB/GumN family protein [Xanthomonadaceae bacterium]